MPGVPRVGYNAQSQRNSAVDSHQRRPAAVRGAAAVTAEPRLEADRAELAPLADATFGCADGAMAAGLRTRIHRLAEDLARRR
jgi:hypothetical protein